MCLTVLLEMFSSLECLLTLRAGKPSLITVSSPVTGQFGLGRKAPAAALVLTGVGPLTSVEHHVGLQLGLLSEHLSADLAGGLTHC